MTQAQIFGTFQRLPRLRELKYPQVTEESNFVFQLQES